MSKPQHYWIKIGSCGWNEYLDYSGSIDEIGNEPRDMGAGDNFYHKISTIEHKNGLHVVDAQSYSELEAKCGALIEAHEKLYKIVGACAYSNTHLWGDVMEAVYRTTKAVLEKHGNSSK